MRVGIISDTFLPENKAVSIRMYHLANAFQQTNSAVTVHTSCKQTEAFTFVVKQNILGAPSSDSGTVKRLIAEILLGIEVFFRIIFCKYELVIISSPPFFTSFFAAVAAWIRGIPYVFDVRDEYPEVYFAAGLLRHNSFPGKILISIERFIYQKSFLVITVTEGIFQHIMEKIDGKRVQLVRNGFDEELFKPSIEKEKSFTVVFHGNIGKFQNPSLIIELAQLANKRGLPISFKVIGWGNNDVALKTIALPNLTFYGMMEYQKIPKIIAEAHIGISFRSSDIISVNSFPVKLYEYIGVGLPMIVTPFSEAGKFIEEGKLGFQFSGESAEDILDTLEELYKNPDQLKEITDNVVKVRSQFSRQSISQSFVISVKNKLASFYA